MTAGIVATVERPEVYQNLRLRGSGDVVIRVRTADGEPAEKARAILIRETVHELVRPDEPGVFRMEGLAPGRYTLRIHAERARKNS